MFKNLKIESFARDYDVHFYDHIELEKLDPITLASSHFIIDKKVAEIYEKQLEKVLNAQSVLLIDATENNKSLHQFPFYVEHLVKNKIRRNHRLIAIGGGIIQDITCFLAATILRGVEWWFYPTTLLAQADSCIGSKSSINCGDTKNILGTYTPPTHVFICSNFLLSLARIDLQSGVGEMLKIHAIDSLKSFDEIAQSYDKIFSDHHTMLHYIYRSLQIKKRFIEEDEFDKGKRNLLNYGHTFGHAIESATQYQIPHGVAVTMGMDMANFISAAFKFGLRENFERMHPALKKNYQQFIHFNICLDAFIEAIGKDKKNMGANQLGLILPDASGQPSKVFYQNDPKFKNLCHGYFDTVRIN